MKSYSFYFNATDWLASPAVKLMSKAERGAYIDLLAVAWNQKEPGTLPASEDKVRRLAELSPAEWAVSGEVLLEQFPLADCGTFRYNPRLLAEVEKQRELSEKNAENGRKSAERRAAAKAAAEAERQRKANENSTVVAPQPTTVEKSGNETSTKLSQAKQPTTVGKQDAGGRAGAERKAEESDLPTYTADTWPGLTNPKTFEGICRDLRLPVDLHCEAYRAVIQDKMRQGKVQGLATTLRSWISGYFLKEQAKGALLTLTVGLPTKPTPREEWPEPGKERPGQIIAIEGVPHDESLNRMKVAAMQKHYPTATIHAIR